MKPQNINKGDLGERLVSEALARLPAGYQTFNNLILPIRRDSGHTTQIDHVVTSEFGIIVVETKKFEGTIVGRAEDRRWLQILGSHRFSFPNPLHQNLHHVEVLGHHLGLSSESFHPVVVFVGLATLAPGLPPNVICTIATGVPDLRRYIESLIQPVLSPAQLEAINRELTDLAKSGLTMDYHLRSIRNRDLERRMNRMLQLSRTMSCRAQTNMRVRRITGCSTETSDPISAGEWILRSMRAQLIREKDRR